MATINGTLYVAEVDGVAFACSTSAELNINQELYDTTCKDSAGWAEHGNGLRDWSVSVEGLTDYSVSFNTIGLSTMIENRSQATVTFVADSGKEQWSGTASLANLTVSAPMEEAVTFSGELTGTGALTRTTTA